MVTRLILVLLGLIHLANGLWMLTAPEAWYAAVPGVAMTGPLNHHFIQDIGLAFLASGDRKSTRLNSSHCTPSRMPSSA